MHSKSQEARVRSLARRIGYYVTRSREWKNVPHANNHGEYMLIEAEHGSAVLGFRYDATLDDIEAYLRD